MLVQVSKNGSEPWYKFCTSILDKTLKYPASAYKITNLVLFRGLVQPALVQICIRKSGSFFLPFDFLGANSKLFGSIDMLVQVSTNSQAFL